MKLLLHQLNEFPQSRMGFLIFVEQAKFHDRHVFDRNVMQGRLFRSRETRKQGEAQTGFCQGKHGGWIITKIDVRRRAQANERGYGGGNGRAAVADPPVLILDEATSSIDTRTEKLVQEGMDHLMKGRTTFVIAHRLSTIQNSDCIMVLEQGRIIERGNHNQLIEEKGKYYQLYTGKTF